MSGAGQAEQQRQSEAGINAAKWFADHPVANNTANTPAKTAGLPSRPGVRPAHQAADRRQLPELCTGVLPDVASVVNR